MRDDDGVAIEIAILGVAALLRDESESVVRENAEEVLGGKASGHGQTLYSRDDTIRVRPLAFTCQSEGFLSIQFAGEIASSPPPG